MFSKILHTWGVTRGGHLDRTNFSNLNFAALTFISHFEICSLSNSSHTLMSSQPEQKENQEPAASKVRRKLHFTSPEQNVEESNEQNVGTLFVGESTQVEEASQTESEPSSQQTTESEPSSQPTDDSEPTEDASPLTIISGKEAAEIGGDLGLVEHTELCIQEIDDAPRRTVVKYSSPRVNLHKRIPRVTICLISAADDSSRLAKTGIEWGIHATEEIYCIVCLAAMGFKKKTSRSHQISISGPVYVYLRPAQLMGLRVRWSHLRRVLISDLFSR